MGTKGKKTPDKEALALLEQIQRKMAGTTEEEVLAALAADKKLRSAKAASKESRSRRASA